MLPPSGDQDPRARKAVEEAGRALERVAALVEDLGHYARLASGEARLHPAPASLGEILRIAAGGVTLPATPTVDVLVQVPAEIDITIHADVTRLAEACGALATALARAQVEDSTVLLTTAPENRPDRPSILISLAPLRGSAAAGRPARLERSGAGLSLATADLIVRLHGGTLAERWTEEAWAGYVVRL